MNTTQNQTGISVHKYDIFDMWQPTKCGADFTTTLIYNITMYSGDMTIINIPLDSVTNSEQALL